MAIHCVSAKCSEILLTKSSPSFVTVPKWLPLLTITKEIFSFCWNYFIGISLPTIGSSSVWMKSTGILKSAIFPMRENLA